MLANALSDYVAGRPLLDVAREVVDVSIVYYIIYRSLLVMRGTRAIQIGIGLLLIFVLYVLSYELHLVTLLSILSALIPGAVILILVVVFQNDIRRGLMRIGSQPWLGMTRARESQAIDEVVEAATELAKHRIGAIIAFEQDANVDEFIGVNKGHTLDAAVSSELLVSIFIPEGVNKLHDGAVIIRNLRVAKAGVFFPMPESRVLDPSFGSRHRAALGITEETDAVVVVVSEERGTISFCFNGNIVSNLDGPGLRRALEGVFSPRRRRAKSASRRAPESQRLSEPALSVGTRSVETARSRAEPTRVEGGEDATLVSVPAEPEGAQTTRIRSTETESEPPPPSAHPPAPLRKAKPEKADTEKTDGETARATLPNAPRVQRLTTPMRSPTTPLPTRGGGTPETYSGPPSDDGRNPDSNDGSEL